MVNNPFRSKPIQRAAVTIERAAGFFKRTEADGKGNTRQVFGQWNDKIPHPNNMEQYPTWNRDPQVRVGINLKTNMIAVNYYLQMPEEDRSGKAVDAKHKNLKTITQYLKDIEFREKYKQIQRQKYEMGFCAVERLSDGKLKILPSESIYMWKKATDLLPYKYTQEYNRSVVAEWKGDDPNFLMFIHNEDPQHPYGCAEVDSIGGLVDGMKQLNVDMPKIIHRYSSPKGIWQFARDISIIKQNVIDSDVDEDLFLGNVDKEELNVQFFEPTTQVKFLEYIDQMNFQIGQALHAPLILLLKNATEASATKMLESVALEILSEQEQNASIIEQRLFLPICGDPIPEFLHGATDEELKEVTLDQIGNLQGNKTVTWKQAQDLIRQKGIALIEDVEPQPDPILGNKNPNDPSKPLLNQDKSKELEMYLQIIKANYDSNKLLLSEALKEGERVIKAVLDKVRHEANVESKASMGHALGPEVELHFELIRKTLFEEFRESLLPGLKPKCASH